MRPDMSKVIVERPRRGSRLRNHKSALALDPSRIDDDRYIDPPEPRHSGEKSLNENLAPLRRYLERNVGRPWSKVHAEIMATLDSRKATGLHILQHLVHFVATSTWLEGRTVMEVKRWGRGGPEPVTGLYVHPVSKLLRRAPDRKKAVRARTVSEVSLHPNTVCRLIDEVWYRFEYGVRDPDEIAEVVRFHEDQPARNRKYGLDAPGDRRIVRYRDLPPSQARYLVRSRQCTRQEVGELDERIRLKKLA